MGVLDSARTWWASLRVMVRLGRPTTCLRCGGGTRRSGDRTPFETFVKSVSFLRAFRCLECGHRFYAFSRRNPTR